MLGLAWKSLNGRSSARISLHEYTFHMSFRTEHSRLPQPTTPEAKMYKRSSLHRSTQVYGGLRLWYTSIESRVPRRDEAGSYSFSRLKNYHFINGRNSKWSLNGLDLRSAPSHLLHLCSTSPLWELWPSPLDYLDRSLLCQLTAQSQSGVGETARQAEWTGLWAVCGVWRLVGAALEGCGYCGPGVEKEC